MVSWATKMAIRDNIHTDIGVIKDANFKSEVKFDLCYEAIEAIIKVADNMHIAIYEYIFEHVKFTCELG